MSTTRTRVRRAPARGVYDTDVIHEILDAGLVAHLGFVEDQQPYVIPTLYARLGERVYLHGSSASRMVRRLAAGIPACLTVTHVDGLVLARSAFHHSINYRSVVVLGTCRLVEDSDETLEAIRLFTDRLIPGRWDQVRWPTPKELKGTRVLTMDLSECSAKVRTGPPVDDDEDYALDTWAGVVPLHTAAGAPEPDPLLRDGIECPPNVSGWAQPPSCG